jgi:hypothetical protein
MMQCYSGYTGTLTLSQEYKDINNVTKKMNKYQIENHLRNVFKKDYIASWEKVISITVKRKNKIEYIVTAKIKYNWEANWKQIGIYTHLYQGTNWALIDLGAGIFNVNKWLGK